MTFKSGILLSGNECSQIMLSLLLTYFGGQGHRPRLVSMGVVCSGISSLLIVIPHFVYGKSGPAINCKFQFTVLPVTVALHVAFNANGRSSGLRLLWIDCYILLLVSFTEFTRFGNEQLLVKCCFQLPLTFRCDLASRLRNIAALHQPFT